MRLFFFLVLLFPILELAVLIKVGSAIGVLATLLLLLLGAVLGFSLIRLAGFSTAWRTQERLQRGELPEQEMLNGLIMTGAGLLLAIPGFLSDLLAVLILLPWTRHLMVKLLQLYVAYQLKRQQAQVRVYDVRSRTDAPSGHSSTHTTHIIEGEWERRDR